jgi:Right handed beta helix region
MHALTNITPRRAGLLLAGVAAALAVSAPQASAAKSLACGSTITKSTTLTHDITGCPGVGLKIGADGITLDLDGHTVSAAAERNPKAHGILNEGHDRVTIRGGTVSGFGAYGVRLSHADGNVVRDMQLTGNFTGVGLFESDRGLVTGNTMAGSKFVGANLTGGKRDRVVDNRIGGSAGPGVFVHSSPAETGLKHRVARNVLAGNGIEIHPGPAATRLVSNTITGAHGDGILVFEPSTLLRGNAASGNLAHGINAPNGASDGGANTAASNGLQPQCVGIACA